MAIITNKPNMNYGLWAENGNIEQPSNEKVELGWIIEKPRNETMNWLQNRQDKMELSVYTVSADECGNNNGITSSGNPAIVGRTIASILYHKVPK